MRPVGKSVQFVGGAVENVAVIMPYSLGLNGVYSESEDEKILNFRSGRPSSLRTD